MAPATPARTGRHCAVPAASRRPAAARRPARAAATALAVGVLLCVLAALAAVVVVPRLTGATSLVVLTGSMAPGMPAGSVAVVRPVEAGALHIGDVVTYEVAGGGSLITHRVVAIGHDASGAVELTTRGDANDDDDQPVPASAVRGRLWYSVPWVGWVSNLLSGSAGGVPQRGLALLLAGAGLLVYAVCQVAGVARERRRARLASAATEPIPGWTGRTASRELAVVTLHVAGGLDADALEHVLEEHAGTVIASTDSTVSVAVTAAPAVVHEAVSQLRALAPVDVQRSGPLAAPLGPGSP
ncbi:signal peptidase I [Quadrisphaera granulorum]|uniref:Signal peptidase I n=1 Tax=Quadrisphaera granulorum TaxID=317664 RepID=A0A315ZWP2_9ACTN|nr:signal peptidase I [Quadrisphaera granulorum]PWJ49014.1 signal peptidase I [Quadrisphaera granulorum]SZE98224.1 signal peptidase I [Quadrisphaera granulorum]